MARICCLLELDVFKSTAADVLSCTSAMNFKFKKRIKCPNDIHRIRAMPQNKSIVAVKTITPVIPLFDVSVENELGIDLSEVDEDDTGESFRVVHDCLIGSLVGHEKGNGWSLEWNPHHKGHVVSGSDDSIILEWHVDGSKLQENWTPVRKYSAHTQAVSDLSWVHNDPNSFASVSDDATLCLWDTRQEKHLHRAMGHFAEVNAVACSLFNSNEILTGSGDTTVMLWDQRKLQSPKHIFRFHCGSVNHVRWSPFHEHIFASCSDDRRVCLWDASSQGGRDTLDMSPAEAVFLHGGHTDCVQDIAWCPGEEWLIGSVGDDNVMHIWSMFEENRPSECLEVHIAGPKSQPLSKIHIKSQQKARSRKKTQSTHAIKSENMERVQSKKSENMEREQSKKSENMERTPKLENVERTRPTKMENTDSELSESSQDEGSGDKSKSTKRRKYSSEEKFQAVMILRKHGIARAESETGIKKSTIYGWTRKIGNDIPGGKDDTTSESPSSSPTSSSVGTSPAPSDSGEGKVCELCGLYLAGISDRDFRYHTQYECCSLTSQERCHECEISLSKEDGFKCVSKECPKRYCERCARSYMKNTEWENILSDQDQRPFEWTCAVCSSRTKPRSREIER
eukprot:975551_1